MGAKKCTKEGKNKTLGSNNADIIYNLNGMKLYASAAAQKRVRQSRFAQNNNKK